MVTLERDLISRLQQIAANRQALLNTSQLSGSPYQSAQNVNYEFEVRFKSFRSKLQHGVPYTDFDRIREYYRQTTNPSQRVKSTDYVKNLTRGKKVYSIIHAANPNDPPEVRWMLKAPVFTRPEHLDNKQYAIRYAFSTEQIIPAEGQFRYNLQRDKDRESFYLLDGAFRLDLTEINTILPSSGAATATATELKKSYEIELEILDWNQIVTHLANTINHVLKILHDTESIYNLTEYQEIVKYYNETLQATGSHIGNLTFNHRVLFQARNLHYKDMVGGGLIGNVGLRDDLKVGWDRDRQVNPLPIKNFTYKVTIKADGVRKLLVLHYTGLWLVMAPNEANLVIRTANEPNIEIQGLIGTILEGELIPNDNQHRRPIPGTPTTKYWFLVYDCLARASIDSSKQPSRWGDPSIQKERHGIRMAHAQELVGQLRDSTSVITIQTKRFYPEDKPTGFATSTELFDTIVMLENLKPTNHYYDDGYIFMPVEMPYDLQVKYKNKKYRQSIWRQTNPIGSPQPGPVWTSEEHWSMIKNGDQLIDKGGNFADDEVRWFTKQKIVWSTTDGQNWQSRGTRQWTTRDPISPREETFPLFRRMTEIRGTMFQQGDKLIKTIITIEDGKGRVSKIPLNLRDLTVYPDICKWKPARDLTNDFSLEWRKYQGQDRLILNMSGPDLPNRPDEGSLVPFTGTELFPFITDPVNQPFGPPNLSDRGIPLATLLSGPIDWNNSLTRDKPTGTIVEYKWDEEQNLLVPVKIRPDKSLPNRIPFAKDNWDQVQYPIDLFTLRGESFKLMSRYHNTIKKQLYNSAYQQVGSAATILDIGSGRGGDVLKWKRARRIVAVEPNLAYLTELTNRIKNIFNQTAVEIINSVVDSEAKIQIANNRQDQVIIINTGGENSALITAVVNKWLGGPAKILSLMLSMSFFWQNEILLAQLYQTIVQNLAADGLGIFLTIDGQLVQQAFSPAKFTNQRAIGGQSSEIDFLRLGQPPNQATLRYFNEQNKLEIYIPETIVTGIFQPEEDLVQTEGLVQLTALEPGLKLRGWQLTNLQRADQEQLLNAAEDKLSKLYTGGQISPIITKPTAIKEEKMKPIITPSETRIVPSKAAKVASPPQITIPTKPPVQLIVSAPTERLSQTILPPKPLPSQNLPSQNLPMLPISYDPQANIAIGDDRVEVIKVKWYNLHPVVRIAAIGDGSCFFHSILKAFYPPYANNNSYSHRSNLVKMLRRDLAALLSMPDPSQPGRTYYETAADGAWLSFYEQQLLGVDFNSGKDFSLDALEKLFNSTRDVGDEVYQYVGDMLGIDIYITIATTDNLNPQLNTSRRGREYPTVIIAGNGSHYEPIGVRLGAQGIQTVFYGDDPFLIALRKQAADEQGAYSP